MTTARWLRSLLTGNPELYRLIYDWNCYPHRWALPAWLEGGTAPAPVIVRLESSERGRARLSRHYRAVLQLDDTFWDFSLPSRRLALLPAATLARLAALAGAARHWSGLSRLVTQKAYRDATDAIGAEAHAFALRRGRSLTAAAGLATPESLPLPAEAGRVPHAGWLLLAACLAAEPATLQRRFRLKSPPALALGEPGPAAPTPAQAWAFIAPILDDTLSPEERACFA